MLFRCFSKIYAKLYIKIVLWLSKNKKNIKERYFKWFLLLIICLSILVFFRICNSIFKKIPIDRLCLYRLIYPGWLMTSDTSE